ncbi:MAG TPA: SurA N-terminal domain-containing protein [Gemmatimonadales bacterium]|jgi:peptidyl-prolyl cis-trans isomerase D|nr:SurA N-terminal domain-containing protein [Gemmatimonadales bacterium]
MMQFFRSIAKPLILVTAIAFFTWLVVDLSGLSGGGGLLTRTSVGKINGTSVDIRAFQARVQQAIEVRQRQTGASLSLEEIAQVRDQVWEQEIQEIIFRAEYERYGLRTTPAEIAEAIRVSPPREIIEDPTFHTDGKFDITKYQRWLTSSMGQQAIPYLEERYRQELLRGKLLRRLLGDVYVSDAALWERYRDEKETVRVGMLVINPERAIPDSAAPVTTQEVEEYYRAHRDEFQRSHAAFLSYLALPRLPDASDTAAARQRILGLRDEIAKGTPFAEVARRESSDTVSGSKGGELGEMTRASVDPAFAAAAMTLPLNTLSDPVQSSFGFHLIEVQSRKGDTFTARHILVPIEVAGSHRDWLDRRADSLEQLAAERLEPSALDTAASALKLRIGKRGPIGEGSRVAVPEGGQVPDVSIWAFQAQAGEESPVIEAEKAFMVFRLDSVQAEGVPPLSAIRAQVEQRVRLEKKRAASKALGQRLAQQVGPGTLLKQLAQGPGLSYQEIGPIARLSTSLPAPELIGAAFGAPQGGVAGPVAAADSLYLFQGLERTPVDSAGFLKERDRLRAEGLQFARQSRVRAYVAALRASAKIVDRRADIFKTGAQTAAANTAPLQY